MVSHLRFARINFEQKLNYTNEGPQVKLNRERSEFQKIISFDQDINSILKNGDRKYSEWINNKRKGYRPHKVSSLEDKIEWQFGDIISNKNFIFGRLAKYKGHVIHIRDEKRKGFKQDIIKEAFLGNFLIYLPKHVLVYEFRKNVGELAPIKLIEDVFNSYFEGTSRISISMITDNRKILERLEKLEYITKILLHVKPTNPNSTPSSDQMDKLLKGMQASRATFEIHSTRGLDLEGGKKFLQSGLKLAEEGYGSAKVIGPLKESEISGEKRLFTINSLNLPINETVNLPADDKKKAELLMKKIEEVEDRMSL